MIPQANNRTPLFVGLAPPQQALLEERLQPVQFAPGETLFTAGQPATRMFRIESGRVRLVTERGQVLAIVGPGSILGDQYLLSGSTDFAQPIHSNFADEEMYADGQGGNMLFHNSFEIIFQRTS